MKDIQEWGSSLLGQAQTALAPAATAAAATASTTFKLASDTVRSGASVVKTKLQDNLGNLIGASHTFSDESGNEVVVQEVALIAEGGFGAVMRVRDRSGQEYALKKIRCVEGLQVTSSLEAAEREAKVLLALPPHPSIIRCFGYVTEPSGPEGQDVKLLLELCSGGHLLHFLDRHGGVLKAAELLEPFSQIVDAVRHLHDQRPPIQHRDLKIENVLLDGESNRWKLCDFGSCSTQRVPAEELPRARLNAIQEDIDKTVTMLYRPPEMADISMNAMKGYTIDEQVDLWMLGCILYTLAFYRHPFQDNATAMAILNAKYFIPSDHPYARSAKLCGLVHWLLAADPQDRPTAAQLCEILSGLSKCPYEQLFKLMPSRVQEKIQRLQQLSRSRKPENGDRGTADPADVTLRPPPAPQPVAAPAARARAATTGADEAARSNGRAASGAPGGAAAKAAQPQRRQRASAPEGAAAVAAASGASQAQSPGAASPVEGLDSSGFDLMYALAPAPAPAALQQAPAAPAAAPVASAGPAVPSGTGAEPGGADLHDLLDLGGGLAEGADAEWGDFTFGGSSPAAPPPAAVPRAGSPAQAPPTSATAPVANVPGAADLLDLSGFDLGGASRGAAAAPAPVAAGAGGLDLLDFGGGAPASAAASGSAPPPPAAAAGGGGAVDATWADFSSFGTSSKPAPAPAAVSAPLPAVPASANVLKGGPAGPKASAAEEQPMGSFWSEFGDLTQLAGPGGGQQQTARVT